LVTRSGAGNSKIVFNSTAMAASSFAPLLAVAVPAESGLAGFAAAFFWAATVPTTSKQKIPREIWK